MLRLVVLSGSVFSQTEESCSHGGNPNVSLRVLLDIKDSDRIANAYIYRVEVAGCVKIAQAVSIGSYPGSSLVVLAEGEDSALI